MLSQVATNQFGQKIVPWNEVVVTLSIREFLWMNPPRFSSSITNEDPEKFIEELKKGVRCDGCC